VGAFSPLPRQARRSSLRAKKPTLRLQKSPSMVASFDVISVRLCALRNRMPESVCDIRVLVCRVHSTLLRYVVMLDRVDHIAA
jgi:hypothetical protein